MFLQYYLNEAGDRVYTLKVSCLHLTSSCSLDELASFRVKMEGKYASTWKTDVV